MRNASEDSASLLAGSTCCLWVKLLIFVDSWRVWKVKPSLEKKKNPGLRQSMLVVILFRWELMLTSQDLLYVRYPSECCHRNECPALAGETSSISHVHDQRLMDITTRNKWLNGPIKREKKRFYIHVKFTVVLRRSVMSGALQLSRQD